MTESIRVILCAVLCLQAAGKISIDIIPFWMLSYDEHSTMEEERRKKKRHGWSLLLPSCLSGCIAEELSSTAAVKMTFKQTLCQVKEEEGEEDTATEAASTHNL